MKHLIALLLAGLAAGAHAGIDCTIGGERITLHDGMADFNYSPSGKPGVTGKVSLFRLMGLGEDSSPLGTLELKAVDVTGAGDYALSLASGWRSAIHFERKRQRVTGGKFTFTRFEMRDHTGRAAGRVEFTTDKTRGSCSFDVEVKGINRDRLGA
jgi:hypothetical protein